MTASAGLDDERLLLINCLHPVETARGWACKTPRSHIHGCARAAPPREVRDRTALISEAPGGVEGPRRRAVEDVWVLSSRGTTRSRRMPPPRPATVARRERYPRAPSASVAPLPLCPVTLQERPPGQHGTREKAKRETYAQFDRAFVAPGRPVAWSGESRSYPSCQGRPLSGRFRRLGSDATGIARDAAVTRRCPPPTRLLLKCP